jgi:hypothetical protein
VKLFEATPGERIKLDRPVAAPTVGELRRRVIRAVDASGVLGRVNWEVCEFAVSAKDVAELRSTGKWTPDLVAAWTAVTDRGTHRQVRWKRL